MGPLSMDLRKRIVQAYENGEGSHALLAKRFAVSRAVVGKLMRQQRGLGTLEPQMHRRGRKPAIAGAKEEQLRQHLRDHPDATLQERIVALKIDCTVKTMWQTLRRWGWRYKKSHRAPPNRTAPTSPSGVPMGRPAKATSIPSGACLPTKQA
jgi:transposase